MSGFPDFKYRDYIVTSRNGAGVDDGDSKLLVLELGDIIKLRTPSIESWRDAGYLYYGEAGGFVLRKDVTERHVRNFSVGDQVWIEFGNGSYRGHPSVPIPFVRNSEPLWSGGTGIILNEPDNNGDFQVALENSDARGYVNSVFLLRRDFMLSDEDTKTEEPSPEMDQLFAQIKKLQSLVSDLDVLYRENVAQATRRVMVAETERDELRKRLAEIRRLTAPDVETKKK